MQNETFAALALRYNAIKDAASDDGWLDDMFINLSIAVKESTELNADGILDEMNAYYEDDCALVGADEDDGISDYKERKLGRSYVSRALDALDKDNNDKALELLAKGVEARIAFWEKRSKKAK